MNQSIRDNPNKMMPVPYNLSETHQGFPTSSPCPRFSAAKNCDFRTRFGAPVSSACAMTPGSARRHKPGTLLCLGSASLIYRYPGILTSPSATSATRSGSVSWKNDQGMMKLCARYIPILRCHRSAEVSCLWTPIAA